MVIGINFSRLTLTSYFTMNIYFLIFETIFVTCKITIPAGV